MPADWKRYAPSKSQYAVGVPRGTKIVRAGAIKVHRSTETHLARGQASIKKPQFYPGGKLVISKRTGKVIEDTRTVEQIRGVGNTVIYRDRPKSLGDPSQAAFKREAELAKVPVDRETEVLERLLFPLGGPGNPAPGVKVHNVPKTKSWAGQTLQRLAELDPRPNEPPIVTVMRRRRQIAYSSGHNAGQRAGSGKLKWVTEFQKIALLDGEFYKLFMCFSGMKAFFVEEDHIEQVLRLSRDYLADRAREIMLQRNYEKIVWFEVYSLK